MTDKFNHKFLLKVSIFIAIAWSVVIFIFAGYNTYKRYSFAYEIALNEARVSVKKDLAYRSWVASHGGVYVPITKRTQPNPYLSHIPNRDITTTDGMKLTLMNPAYTLSQMMKDYSELYGIKAKITSKNLLNPKNFPDEWEQKALEVIEKIHKPFFESEDINGKPFMRYLNPLTTKKDCLKCHAHQGYEIGQIRGGVAVSIPLEEHLQEALSHSRVILLTFFIVWIIGLFFIYFAYKKIKNTIEAKVTLYEQSVYTLVDLIEKRDSYTAGHSKRVAQYCVLVAKQMNLPKDDIDLIYRAGMLHDIGKISTPDLVLLKPGKLNDLEYSLIQQHVTSSYEILNRVDVFEKISEIVRHHHEKYDGTGYPQGLKGDEIPILSAIISLCDAFDAMTTSRIYKGRKLISTAIKEIESLKGKQFHPEVADAAMKVLSDVLIDINITQRPHTLIEQERFAFFYNDQLTGVYNKEYLKYIMKQRTEKEFNYNCVYTIYMNNFTQYNKKYGWEKGNDLLREFARELSIKFKKGLVFRVLGDVFLVLHYEHNADVETARFDSLGQSEVSLKIKHIDIHESDLDFNDLEILKKEN
jgi:diguanylate cyclase (GGDEF)-like protein/putative nucleotidyltransferase with HDIG domain